MGQQMALASHEDKPVFETRQFFAAPVSDKLVCFMPFLGFGQLSPANLPEVLQYGER
ncbi:hypothetical protein E4U41_001496 [Claviceps citrina]|nr:hypothetical protein E4U41_001496 [Claviceps citrina]